MKGLYSSQSSFILCPRKTEMREKDNLKLYYLDFKIRFNDGFSANLICGKRGEVALKSDSCLSCFHRFICIMSPVSLPLSDQLVVWSRPDLVD